MHTHIRSLSLLALLALSFDAAATKAPATPANSARADAYAEAEAEAEATASARQSQELEANQTTEQTASQRNRQEAVMDSSYTDSSTLLYAASVIPPECGVAGNAGGASNGDAGFLGVAWTTERCYSFRAAAMWFQLGAIDLGCEMLADATRHQLKRRGITHLDCNAIAARFQKAAASSAPPAEKPDSVTHEELEEYVGRAFKASQSK